MEIIYLIHSCNFAFASASSKIGFIFIHLYNILSSIWKLFLKQRSWGTGLNFSFIFMHNHHFLIIATQFVSFEIMLHEVRMLKVVVSGLIFTLKITHSMPVIWPSALRIVGFIPAQCWWTCRPNRPAVISTIHEFWKQQICVENPFKASNYQGYKLRDLCRGAWWQDPSTVSC